eukprot:maker-scaffold300_size216557-snap-gene-1.33 protein:Tk07149 transcript:maker-scaffold300_size216557-snap-gene-1.33-mRNA-1 annotation:"hypothetical protein DICPUDRAFT_57722"
MYSGLFREAGLASGRSGLKLAPNLDESQLKKKNSSSSIMKVFAIILTLALAASSVSADCATCLVGVNGLLDYLGTSGEVAEEAAVVKAQCCPALDDPAGCETGVDTWWPLIVAALEKSENIAAIACAALDPSCIATRAWDCDTCVTRVNDLLDVATGDAQLAVIVAYLKGDAFCKDASVSPDAEACAAYIDALAPCAIQALVDVARAEPERFCAGAFDIC